MTVVLTDLPTPLAQADRLIALCRDVTADTHHQRLLKALHDAGRDLAALAPDQLAEMSAEERVELLKQNIVRFTNDLLHYDVIELRLLDRRTGHLEKLLSKGMTPEEAHLALKRHATSKLQRIEDLFSLHTMGFRGEALPSIAAVSRLTLVTRPADSIEGYRLVVEGGEEGEVTGNSRPAGAPRGTQIAQLKITVKSRWSDILLTVLTAGLVMPRSVTYQGIVVGR